MRSLRPAAASAAFLASLLVALASRADAFDLKLWPLVDVASHQDETTVRLLGPIVEWRRDAEGRSFALRPFLHLARPAAEDATRGLLLYPLAWWDRTPDSFFLRVFGVLTYERRAAPTRADPWTRRFQIFPFVFYRSGPERGASLSVLPIYANLTNFFGYERIRMLLFPLFLKLDLPMYDRTYLPWPFFSWVGGRAGSGVRVWPIYGRTRVGEQSDTLYAPWPLYIRDVQHPGREGEVRTRLSWPLFSAIDGPRIESRSYAFLPLFVLPLYTRTIDRAADTETKGFPWPVWVSQRDRQSGERLSLRLMPLYEDRKTEAMRSRFFLWPIYRRKDGRGDLASYRRSDVFLLVYRDQWEGEGATRVHTHALIPLGMSIADRDGGHGQSLAGFEAAWPKNERVALLYPPIYRLYAWETSGGSTRRDVLWRFWEWGGARARPPWYFSRR